MAKYPPMKVLLGSELWEESLVAGLSRLGHSVTLLDTDDPDLVIISRRAWRIPKDISQVKVVEHVEMVMKQVRLLQHEDQTKGQQPEGTAPEVPKKPARKRATKKNIGGGGASTPIVTESHTESGIDIQSGGA
jgi:hypothetical protein